MVPFYSHARITYGLYARLEVNSSVLFRRYIGQRYDKTRRRIDTIFLRVRIVGTRWFHVPQVNHFGTRLRSVREGNIFNIRRLVYCRQRKCERSRLPSFSNVDLMYDPAKRSHSCAKSSTMEAKNSLVFDYRRRVRETQPIVVVIVVGWRCFRDVESRSGGGGAGGVLSGTLVPPSIRRPGSRNI